MATRSDRLPLVLFALLVGMCVVFALTFVITERPHDEVVGAGGVVERVPLGHGSPHATYPSMDHGGDGPARAAPVLPLAWAFAVLQLAFIFGSLLLGVRHPARIRTPLVMSGVTLAVLLTLMFVTYARDAGDTAAPQVLGLPVPTAWFVYGFWPAEFLVVALFVLYFGRAVVTPDGMRRYRQILAERQARAGER